MRAFDRTQPEKAKAMSQLHLATDDQLMFVGELIDLIHRIQSQQSDEPKTTRDWLSQCVDSLADLSACHEELSTFTAKLRELSRTEGGQGVEDTDGEGDDEYNEGEFYLLAC